jgi:hypothetical protein
MTQASLALDAPANTKYEATRAYFLQHPGEWVSALELQKVGGWLSWRTRVSDCRLSGMTIENRLRKVEGRTVSEYRFVAK